MSHFPLISAGHAALRAVATDTTPATLDQLDKALADLPLTDEVTDGADQIVRLALEMIGHARDHELFRAVGEMEDQVAAMLAAGHSVPVHSHPAMQAVVRALGLCYAGSGDWNTDSANYRAWDRAMHAGSYMVRAVSGFLYAEHEFTPRKVTEQAEEFSAAARRAIAYHARGLARTALTVTAYDYGLFVIGARTSGREPHTWLRSIGSDTFQFEVTPPDLYRAAPAGRLIVTSYKTGKRVHDLALSTDPKRGRAVADALFLI
ncbi:MULTISPECIES: hypothetical protein [unclassified Streptomyces]|uniref:hypothetical protein n=1 Tax=unclassified Streptomyces TaxID=2593676 RepID=UPI002E28225F|nr:hypothetical protein [Streptomyces sp. NBC_01601]WSG56523.1 hypothetical protein OHA38_43625 [Streptomyces sp. NBC_01732]